MNILTKEKENNTMQNIKEHLTSVISQIIAMELENENLKKENEKLLSGFDTDTHILVEKETLIYLVDRVDTIVCDSDSSAGECEDAQSGVDSAIYYADECSAIAENVRDSLEKLLKPKEEETEQSD